MALDLPMRKALLPSPRGPKASRGTSCTLQESKTTVAAMQASTPAEPCVPAARRLSRAASASGPGEVFVSVCVSPEHLASHFLNLVKADHWYGVLLYKPLHSALTFHTNRTKAREFFLSVSVFPAFCWLVHSPVSAVCPSALSRMTVRQ